MKRFVLALALACVLSGSALAGDMPTGGIAPPPNGATQTTTSTSSGYIPTVPGEVPTVGAADQISSAALLGFLALFGLLSA